MGNQYQKGEYQNNGKRELKKKDNYLDSQNQSVSNQSYQSGSKGNASVLKSESFCSTKTYPNVKLYREKIQSKIAQTEGNRISLEKSISNPYNTVGLVIFSTADGLRNYSTGFLITSCLVLTAANPSMIRDNKNGTILDFKPIFFMMGQAENRKIYEVIDFRRPKQFIDIISKLDPQDFLRSSVHQRIQTLLQAQRSDYCLLKLQQNVTENTFMDLLGDYDGYGQNRIIGYNYENQYEDYDYQDKQMIIGHFIYKLGFVCEQQMIKMEINVKNTVVGGPILIKHEGRIAVMGIYLRATAKNKLSNGFLIKNTTLDTIRGWIMQMNQYPKILIYRHRKSSNDYSSKQNIQNQPQIFIQQKDEILKPFKKVQSSIVIQNGQFWNQDSQNGSKFQINGTKVKKIRYNGQTHQIVSKTSIKPIHHQTCKIKVIQYGGKYAICIGLITESRLNKRYSGDYSQKQSIGLWSFNYGKGKGRIFVGGENFMEWDESLFINQGQILTINMNFDENKTEWLIGSKKIAECSLPQSMKNKELYLFVAMERKNDQVQFIL